MSRCARCLLLSTWCRGTHPVLVGSLRLGARCPHALLWLCVRCAWLPFPVSQGLLRVDLATSRHVTTVECGEGVGLAVSPALRLIMTSNADDTISAYELPVAPPGFTCLGTWGSTGPGLLQFNFGGGVGQSGWMCFTVCVCARACVCMCVRVCACVRVCVPLFVRLVCERLWLGCVMFVFRVFGCVLVHE
jgi:hypothetical protein